MFVGSRVRISGMFGSSSSEMVRVPRRCCVDRGWAEGPTYVQNRVESLGLISLGYEVLTPGYSFHAPLSQSSLEVDYT